MHKHMDSHVEYPNSLQTNGLLKIVCIAYPDICLFSVLCSFIATALKLDHTRVIDTSFIFKYSNGSIYRRPSLNKLCKARVKYMFFIVHVIEYFYFCKGIYLPN